MGEMTADHRRHYRENKVVFNVIFGEMEDSARRRRVKVLEADSNRDECGQIRQKYHSIVAEIKTQCLVCDV